MAPRFRRASLFVLPILLTGFSSGCRNCQLVEAELRFQSDRVIELENQVLLKDAEITTLSTTVLALRDELKERGNAPPPESIYRNMGLARIALGPLTGGRDLNNDGRPDAIEAVIIPFDFDDDPFKCPGSAEIEVFQIETNGAKKPIGHWMVDEEKLRDNWRVTVMGQGFQIVEPWQTLPVTGNLRVVARFMTLDGREFEAEKDIPISMAQKLPMSRSAEDCEVSPNAVSVSKRPPRLGDPLTQADLDGDGPPKGAVPVQARWSTRVTTSAKPYVSPAAAWQSKRGTAKGPIVLPVPAEESTAVTDEPGGLRRFLPIFDLPELPFRKSPSADVEAAAATAEPDEESLGEPVDEPAADVKRQPAVRLLAPIASATP